MRVKFVMWAVVVVSVLGTVILAQQSSGPVSIRKVVEERAIRASQSIPVLPTPNVTAPFNTSEYNQANDFCVKAIVWLQLMEKMHRYDVEALNKRLADQTLLDYYSWWEVGQDRWEEINGLIQDYETQINMLSEETNTQVEGLGMYLVSAKIFLQAGNPEEASIVMEIAYEHAISLVSITPASYGVIWGFGPLNLMYELQIEISDLLSEDEHNALIQKLFLELGLHI